MRDPLRKRIVRGILEDLPRYLALFLLLSLSIGFVSGFLVADGSMIRAYNEGFEKYRVEDGHFVYRRRMNADTRRRLEKAGITVFDLAYTEAPDRGAGSRLRIYAERTETDLACLMEGRMPSGAGEIAVDRMYAENNGLKVGDVLSPGGKEVRITGLIALPDYSCLFENNSDSMFDAKAFGVAVVDEKTFASVPEEELTRCYAWIYADRPADEAEEKKKAEELLRTVASEGELLEYTPRYMNQAIIFTGEDMGSDRAMMEVLLYIIVTIIGFVFAVTISGTVAEEAPVIGTLRASGYSRWELIRHYAAAPLLTALAAAIFGNALGYTVLKDLCAGLYYGSYSLPTYVTVWNGEAFLQTTVIPCGLTALILLGVLCVRLRLSPLRFLRRELSRRKGGAALPLPARIPFFHRFRLRVIFQNLGAYLVLFLGILFADVLLMFGMGMPETLSAYEKKLESGMLAEYQVLLQVPADTMNEDRKLESLLKMARFRAETETDVPGAEAFSVWSLQTTDEGWKQEEVLLYGVEDNSRYVRGVGPEDVLISSAYADKYRLKAGDTVTLKEKYEDTSYGLVITGIYDYGGGIAVFMGREALNRMVGMSRDWFGGYFSDEPLTDIDEKYVGSVIDRQALTKISRQLNISFGGMMGAVNVFSLVIFFVLIYILSKMIIEKNAQPISMLKILGCEPGEIRRLYVTATTAVTVISLAAALPLVYRILIVVFRELMMKKMTGWMEMTVSGKTILIMFLLGLAAYGAVSLLEMRRIRRVPMDQALKNAE